MISTPAPRMLIGAAIASLVLLVAGVASASAASPRIVSPKTGKVLALNSQPTFKVKDGSRAARKYSIFMRISTKKAYDKNGSLKKTKSGDFAKMKRKGTTFTYKPKKYTFPGWYMATPGKYYWQAFHIDCGARAKSCEIHTKTGSFRVR